MHILVRDKRTGVEETLTLEQAAELMVTLPLRSNPD